MAKISKTFVLMKEVQWIQHLKNSQNFESWLKNEILTRMWIAPLF
jgi:hypothetical protein